MWRRSTAGTAVLLAAAGLVLGACGGGGGDAAEKDDDAPANSGGGATLAVSVKEFSFDPATLTAGTEFTVVLKNTGAASHDFTVDGTDVMVEAEAGKTASEQVRLEPGTYTFFCSVPGHRPAGMEGTLTVS